MKYKLKQKFPGLPRFLCCSDLKIHSTVIKDDHKNKSAYMNKIGIQILCNQITYDKDFVLSRQYEKNIDYKYDAMLIRERPALCIMITS